MKSIAVYAVNTPAKALFGLYFVLALVFGAAQAAPGATTMPAPPELQSQLPQARLSGAAKLRVLGFEVYNARLWVQPGFEKNTFEQHEFALELQYLRGLKGADIAQRSLAEMKRVATVSDDQAQRWLKDLQDIFPDVQRGDRITGVHTPEGARFIKNGRSLGEVRDAQFANAFFAIWLSPQTSQPRLREQLLAHARAPAQSQ